MLYRLMICFFMLFTSAALADGLMGLGLSPWQAITPAIRGGARSLAMGGVFSAMDASAEALIGNPAALSRASNTKLLVSSRARIWGDEGYNDEFYRYHDNYQSHLEPSASPGMFSLVMIDKQSFEEPITPAIAVGYYSMYDNSISRVETYDDNDAGMHFEYTDRQEGMLDVLSLGLGFSLYRHLRFGVTAGFPISSRFKLLEYRYDQKNTGSEGYSLYDKRFRVKSGLLLTAGVQIDISTFLVLGGTLINGHNLKFSNDYWHESIRGATFNFESFHDHYYGDFHISMPMMWSAGAALHFVKHGVIAVDVESRPWKDVVVDDRDLKRKTNSGYAFRIGAEYGNRVKYRLGCFRDRVPVTGEDNAPVDRFGYTGGIGMDWGAFVLDVGFAVHTLHWEKLIDIWDPLYSVRYPYHRNELMFYTSFLFNL